MSAPDLLDGGGKKEYSTVGEVADRLRLHRLTVRRMIGRGELAAVKVVGRYRIRREDVEAILAGRPAEVVE